MLTPHKTSFDYLLVFDALVRSGAGCALIREGVALRGVQKNHFAIWGHTKADAILSIISSNETSQIPLIMALVSMLKEIWALDPPFTAFKHKDYEN